MKKYFTSESVTEGHPDKICDKISDAILDEALKIDKYSKMAVEATIKDNLVLIYGESKTNANLNYKKIAQKVLKEIGYKEKFNILIKVSEQSKEINNSVCKNEICAGDQGIMFGYACSETQEYMPLSISLANDLAKKLTDVRKNDTKKVLKPDGKTQVTIEYENNQIKRIDTIIISSSHYKNIKYDYLKEYIYNNVIKPIVPKNLIDNNTKILINTSGSFVLCGPFADSGTTGRKIVVDTYGGHAHIGGGCFSSKDPSKVDRSAAYYARYVAKNLVANKICDKCEIEVSYAIGLNKPISIFIDTFDTEKINIEKIYEIIDKYFDFSVSNIINELNLLRPIYYCTASYGHFGRKDIEFPWEKTIKINI